MDDTTAEVVRQLRNMGLLVTEVVTNSPIGTVIHVSIPPVESVASGNKRPDN